MGKQSRLKRERHQEGISKELKETKRKSVLAFFKDDNGNFIAYNPVKKMMQGKIYKDNNGREIIRSTIVRYAEFLKEKGVQVEEGNVKAVEGEKVNEQ